MKVLFWAFFLLISIFSVPTQAASDDDAWYHVPVIVNVAHGCDATEAEIKAMIAKANEILHKANIHFYVKDVNNDYKVGNGNSTFTGREENEAIEDGRQEVGTKKGMKVTIGDTISTIDDPLGIAKHRIPVALIADVNDGEAMGRTLAHEFCHCLTINEDLRDANDSNNTDNLMWMDDEYDGEELNEQQKKEIRKQAEKWGEVSIEPLPLNPKPIPPGGPPQVTYGGVRYKYYPWGVVIDDANETPVIIYDPGVMPHDILTANVISGGTGDSNDVVKISIIPAGLIESIHEFLLIYRIKFDPYPYDDGVAETIIEININSVAGMLDYTEAVITDGGGGEIGRTPFVLDTHYKFRDYANEVNAVAEGSFTSIDVNIPIDMFNGFPGNMFEVPCQVMVESEIWMADSNTSSDDTAWFEVNNYSSANSEDQMGVAYYADPMPGDSSNPNQLPTYEIIGEGFVDDVEIFIDGEYVTTVVADASGQVRAVFEPNITTGMGQQFVEAIGKDSNGEFKRTYAYFLNKEPIEGDLDGDYDVDFVDFVKLADNWLVGVE